MRLESFAQMVQLWRAQQASKVWPKSCSPKPRRAACVHHLQEPSRIHRRPPLVAHTRGWEAKAGTLTPGSAQVGATGPTAHGLPPGGSPECRRCTSILVTGPGPQRLHHPRWLGNREGCSRPSPDGHSPGGWAIQVRGHVGPHREGKGSVRNRASTFRPWCPCLSC